MASEGRRVYGARALGSLVPGVARPAFRRVGPAAAQIMADWATIVGPMLAAASTPRRVSSGTLTIACAGPVAMELQHYATELVSRINTHLGSQTVRTLRFVQTTAAASPPPAAASPPPAAVAEAADSAVAGLPDGELRAALAALGRAVLADAGRTRRSTT